MFIPQTRSDGSTTRRRVRAYFCLMTLVLAGCGGGAYQSAPVDESKAHDTLVEVLDGWKSGERIETLQDQDPSVVVQDFDWLGGTKLIAYEIQGEGKPVNANLVAKVKLTLQDKDGASSEKTVTYLIGTAPTLTVFRDSSQ